MVCVQYVAHRGGRENDRALAPARPPQSKLQFTKDIEGSPRSDQR